MYVGRKPVAGDLGALGGRQVHCPDCLAPWFKPYPSMDADGLHRSDCDRRPRRLPVGWRPGQAHNQP